MLTDHANTEAFARRFCCDQALAEQRLCTASSLFAAPLSTGDSAVDGNWERQLENLALARLERRKDGSMGTASVRPCQVFLLQEDVWPLQKTVVRIFLLDSLMRISMKNVPF